MATLVENYRAAPPVQPDPEPARYLSRRLADLRRGGLEFDQA